MFHREQLPGEPNNTEYILRYVSRSRLLSGQTSFIEIVVSRKFQIVSYVTMNLQI